MMPMMLAEWRTKMRWPQIGLFLLSLLSLLAIPPTAQALEVVFCVPFCLGVGADTQTLIVRGPDVPSVVSGVITNKVSIAQTYKGFTISATVTSQQSATLQKITFNPTAITANADSRCNTSATNPCTIEVIATSNDKDFPTLKPTGGYPAGVFMAGYFTGTEPAHTSPPDPNGDTISMTGEASGLSAANLPLNSDVINATPGSGTGDILVSLPSSCTGKPTCNFTATTALRSFNTQIQETVQQACDPGQTTCRTRLRTTVRVNIKTPGNKVTLPAGTVTVDPPPPGAPPRNQTALLIAETQPPFGTLDVRNLAVASRAFALTAKITLDPGSRINPVGEEVYLRVGYFAMTIPAGKFKQQGNFFTFIGKVDNLNVAAVFERDRNNPAIWGFGAGVEGIRLTGLPLPRVPVDIAVGSDKGSDLVTPTFF